MRPVPPPEDCDFPVREVGLLAAYVGGALPSRTREEVEAHLASCASCCAFLADAVRTEPTSEEGVAPWAGGAASVAGIAVARWRRVAAAAAVLLAAGAAFLALPRIAGDSGGILPVVEGEFIPAGSAEGVRLAAGEGIPAGRGGRIVLADGTDILVDVGAALRLVAPQPGERLRIRMDRGSARFRVARQPGAAVVETAFGSVEVVGTRFSVEHLSAFPPGDGGEPACLQVAVEEGRVWVSCAGGARVLVDPMQRAYLMPGTGPILQNASATPGPAWAERIAGKLEAALASGDRPDAARLLSMLRHQGGHGTEAARVRVEDRSGGPEVRLPWFRVLRVLDPAAAREAYDRMSSSAEDPGDAPPGAPEDPEFLDAMARILERG
mgnify:CR=1 FL=1